VVQFVGDPSLPVPEGSLVWPDSDCAVSRSQLPTSVVARHGDAKIVTFELRSFPLGPDLTWTPAPGRAPIPVVADKLDIVRLTVSRRKEP
jgi:hypothetical protein